MTTGNMSDNGLTNAIDSLKSAVEDPTKGLPEELFLYTTTITPMINVDLFVKNSKGHVLMSWRNDICGNGWHIPGGIIRFKETMHDRILKVGLQELHANVKHDDTPYMINEIILPQNIRGHFISMLYKCYLPSDYEIDNGSLTEGHAGFLKWIERCPESFIMGQRDIYKTLWN